MRHRLEYALAAFACVLALTAPAAAQTPPRHDEALAAAGGPLYRTHCAPCHGPTGRGDGPVASQLRFAPPDLTRLSDRNRGAFPFDTVSRVVDGRKPVKGHGGPEMPVWGDAFKEPGERYSEQRVRDRITRLVHFLASIQER